ncbi:PREDICTED: histidine-rich carboxyl terminus protein 1 [Poecilia mexicana]|uniref:Zinc transporter ZIP6 n=1 Tax=Poecilia mexicana TaxID=48701 RepID=A0A3B3Z3C0_9TELE|nr:PREDICTED: histidine-rich carboxyl terminus protein 1 [Poecilia mexicana]XP_014825817.1 PREDICTED: histidine-rich carboxyl terminus protein 1 [Poecilia mexicana]
MLTDQMAAAILAATLCFAASCVWAAADCSPSPTEASGGARLLTAVVDAQRAERARRQHLEALFHRYGENGSISLDGLKRLLQSVGLDRIRNVMVKHREQAGHHHDHHHHHHHHHHHRHPAADQNRTEDLQQTQPTVSAAPGRDGTGLLVKTQKRSLAGEGATTVATATAVKTEPADHRDELDQDHLEEEECLNASGLLLSHGMSQEGGVALGDFSFLCPALLHQIDSGACLLHGDASGHEGTGHKHHRHSHGHHGNHDHATRNHSEPGSGENGKHIATAWVGGFVSITVISALSLLGVLLIPLMNRVFFKFLLSFLVALAVGTLSGDAFLHLLPHSHGNHDHYNHLDDHDDLHPDGEENMDGVWKGLTALGGVYFMFLIEHFLTLGKMYKDKKQKVQKKWDQTDKSDPEKQPALEESELKPSEDVEPNGAGAFGELPGGVAEEEQVMLTPQVSVVTQQTYGRPAGGGAAGYSAEDCENKCHSHFHDTVGQADSLHHHHHDYHHILHHHHSQNHHPHSHAHSYSEEHFQQAGVATLAWMVIMGDGLHNFSDGLAIGAAFSESLSSGLSTSVAVFCHELPHELGDFAVLLKAGMTVRQAILYNILSAMMAYFGLVTGILIGHYAENVSTWIFALTAGLFMYVALVDMVPEMLHNDAGDHGFSHWGFFLLQNAGILLGFCIMLLIALFEHKIQLDLGY